MAFNPYDQLNNPAANRFGPVINRNALRGMTQGGPAAKPVDAMTVGFANLLDSGGGAALQLAGAEPGSAVPTAVQPASKALPTPVGYRARAARLGAQGTDFTLS